MRILIDAIKQDHPDTARQLDGLEARILDGNVTIHALVAGTIHKATFADDDLLAFVTIIKDFIKIDWKL